MALQVQEKHPLAVRPQAGYHPKSAFSLMDPDVLRDVLFLKSSMSMSPPTMQIYTQHVVT